MKSDLAVYKFGGASVRDAEGVRNMARIVSKYCTTPAVIVVSAMGKMTNALEQLTQAYFHATGDVAELFETVRAYHWEIASELFEAHHEVFGLINDLFVEIEWVLEEEPSADFDYVYDQIVPFGELLSTRIVSAFLQQLGIAHAWLDVRDVIRTDNSYREARVDWQTTQQQMHNVARRMIDQQGIAVTQGFIGCTSENFTSTLGREGSDYTAAIFAYCLDAHSMTIWKDVPGVLTADPQQFENVELIDRLSYREAVEMTYYGAKVIHPKTIKPLQNKSVPLFVKSFKDPAAAGTWIGTDIESPLPPIIVTEQNQVLIHISTVDYSFVAEHHLSMLFRLFAEHRIKINMMRNTAISFTVCCLDEAAKLDAFSQAIGKEFIVVIDRNLVLLTVRHANAPTLEFLLKDKVVVLNERFKDTEQFVLKESPVVVPKSLSSPERLPVRE